MKRKPGSPYPRISQLSPTPHPKGYLVALHAQDQVLSTWTLETFKIQTATVDNVVFLTEAVVEGFSHLGGSAVRRKNIGVKSQPLWTKRCKS